MNGTPSACPVCAGRIRDLGSPAGGDYRDINCARCGEFRITGSALALLLLGGKDEIVRGVVSHSIRRMQRTGIAPLVTNELIREITAFPRLPSPAEQAELLTLWLGDTLIAPGREASLDGDALIAEIGAIDGQGFGFIREALKEQGFLTWRHSTGLPLAKLTFAGWERYEELKRARSESRKGFMAMDFGNRILNQVVSEHFRPAVQEAGFNLMRIDDAPPAGLIDVRLQNEIRTSRFVIADLTDRNPGAYWEAGFAQGLGLPVIYTCEASEFERSRTHFDTNHFHTILWRSETPGDAARRLRDTIRATLPKEAKLEDV